MGVAPDYSKLPADLQKKIAGWEANKPENKQVVILQDIADMTQEVVQMLDKDQQSDSETTKNLGAILMDIRESLKSLDTKEAPETPDYAKPVVAGLTKLETAIKKALNAIEVKPQFNPSIQVAPTPVNVDIPKIDLSGIEKVLKVTLPSAFNQAISLIPPDEPDDFTPITDQLSEMIDWLKSIEKQSRLKPQAPTTIKVSNLSEVSGGLAPLTDFDWLEVTATSSTVDTLEYKTGGSGGSDVLTIEVTYTGSGVEKISDTFDHLGYS